MNLKKYSISAVLSGLILSSAYSLANSIYGKISMPDGYFYSSDNFTVELWDSNLSTKFAEVNATTIDSNQTFDYNFSSVLDGDYYIVAPNFSSNGVYSPYSDILVRNSTNSNGDFELFYGYTNSVKDYTYEDLDDILSYGEFNSTTCTYSSDIYREYNRSVGGNFYYPVDLITFDTTNNEYIEYPFTLNSDDIEVNFKFTEEIYGTHRVNILGNPSLLAGDKLELYINTSSEDVLISGNSVDINFSYPDDARIGKYKTFYINDTNTTDSYHYNINFGNENFETNETDITIYGLDLSLINVNLTFNFSLEHKDGYYYPYQNLQFTSIADINSTIPIVEVDNVVLVDSVSGYYFDLTKFMDAVYFQSNPSYFNIDGNRTVQIDFNQTKFDMNYTISTDSLNFSTTVGTSESKSISITNNSDIYRAIYLPIGDFTTDSCSVTYFQSPDYSENSLSSSDIAEINNFSISNPIYLTPNSTKSALISYSPTTTGYHDAIIHFYNGYGESNISLLGEAIAQTVTEPTTSISTSSGANIEAPATAEVVEDETSGSTTVSTNTDLGEGLSSQAIVDIPSEDSEDGLSVKMDLTDESGELVSETTLEASSKLDVKVKVNSDGSVDVSSDSKTDSDEEKIESKSKVKVKSDGKIEGSFKVKKESKSDNKKKELSRNFSVAENSKASFKEDGSFEATYFINDVNSSERAIGESSTASTYSERSRFQVIMQAFPNGEFGAKVVDYSTINPRKRAIQNAISPIGYSAREEFFKVSFEVVLNPNSNALKSTFDSSSSFNYYNSNPRRDSNAPQSVEITSITQWQRFEEIGNFDGTRSVKLLLGEAEITIDGITERMQKDVAYQLPDYTKEEVEVQLGEDAKTIESEFYKDGKLNLSQGWNLISTPTLEPIESFKINSKVIWEYSSKEWIQNPTTLNPKKGYWILVDSNQTIEIEDSGTYSISFDDIESDWELLGAGDNIKLGDNFQTIYSYSGDWNLNPENLYRAQGFWIKK